MPDLPDFGFAPPPFKAAEALVTLRRQLRELRPLTERGERFELRGCEVIQVALDGEAIRARLAHAPSRQRPQWSEQTLASSVEVRRFVDEVRARMRRWEQED